MAETQRERPTPTFGPSERLEWVGLGIFALFTVVALAGYAGFGLHPERLPDSDLARSIFASAFDGFARAHIVVSATVLFGVLFRRVGRVWIPAALAVYVVSFSAEHLGTGYGIPFGGYAYSGLLGPKLGGRVPFLIPLSWFLMALPAWMLASRAGTRAGRVTLGALWLVAWDLALDPAMSFLTPYWRWSESGPYYGMPWVNLLGWFVTGLLLMVVLDAWSTRARWSRLDRTWMAAYYGVVLAMPLGMVLAAGAWPAAATTLVAMSLLGLASLGRPTPARSPEPAMATLEGALRS